MVIREYTKSDELEWLRCYARPSKADWFLNTVIE